MDRGTWQAPWGCKELDTTKLAQTLGHRQSLAGYGSLDAKDFTSCEISQTEKDKYCITYVKSKKADFMEIRIEWWLPGVEGRGKWGYVGESR